MKNPVIILGLSSPGIFLLRHFSKKGIETFGFECDRNELGFKSRFGIKKVCPDPEKHQDEFIDYLLNERMYLNTKPVVIPVADKFVLPLNDNKDVLSNHFCFTIPKGNILRKLTSKKGSYELAMEYGFPAPKTCFVNDEIQLNSFVKEVEFPCILKPEFPESWRSGFLEEYCSGEKVIIVNSKEELYGKYNVIKKHDDRVIIQEIIPGNDENLHYFVSYMNKEHECLGSFTGIKERIAPVHFGSASYVNIKHNEELEIMCVDWLKNMNFWGISGIEVKKDIRDNKFKLIEVNPRFGLWDEVGTKFGIDIAMMHYKELLNEPIETVIKKNIDIRWISIHRDIRASAEYVSKRILPIGKIVESYFRFPLYISDMKLNDLGLTFYLIKKLIKGLFKKIFGK